MVGASAVNGYMGARDGKEGREENKYRGRIAEEQQDRRDIVLAETGRDLFFSRAVSGLKINVKIPL